MLLGSVRGGCFMLIVLVHVGFVFSACSALLGAHWHIHLPHIRPPSTLSVKLARVTSIYLAKNAKYTTKNCQVPAHKHGEHDKTSAEWSTWELVNWAAYSSASEGLAISLTAAQLWMCSTEAKLARMGDVAKWRVPTSMSWTIAGRSRKRWLCFYSNTWSTGSFISLTFIGEQLDLPPGHHLKMKHTFFNLFQPYILN